MTLSLAKSITDEIFALYEKFGAADYIGEPVSQMEHMSQSAELALAEDMEDEVVLAAFFHDIGHICVQQNQENSMSGFGVMRHEKIGAEFLRQNQYPERIARLVELHVEAKRYLTARNPDYYNSLSEASRQTLEFQGGIMSPDEVLKFEKDPLFIVAIRLRKWDEEAKITNIPVMELHKLKAMSIQVLVRNLPEEYGV